MRVVPFISVILLLIRLSTTSPVSRRFDRYNRGSSSLASSSAHQQTASTSTSAARQLSTSKGMASYDAKVEQKRREKVESLKLVYKDLKKRILIKDPLDMTRDEQLEVAYVRLKLQTQLDNYKRYRKLPYMEDLLGKINKWKGKLTRYTDYVDKATYEDERKRRNAEAVARYEAREKVKSFGIHITPLPRFVKGLKENAHPLIHRKRLIQRISRRRIRERQLQDQVQLSSDRKSQVDELLRKGWGSKGQRSQ